MFVHQHTPSLEPSRCDVWSADSEDSTFSILAFVALVHSSCPVIISMFPAVATSPLPDRGGGVNALVTEFLWISIDAWRSMRTCQTGRELGGGPSHVVLQPTPSWVWQRFLERFETVIDARQLDRSNHQDHCGCSSSAYHQTNCTC